MVVSLTPWAPHERYLFQTVIVGRCAFLFVDTSDDALLDTKVQSEQQKLHHH